MKDVMVGSGATAMERKPCATGYPLVSRIAERPRRANVTENVSCGCGSWGEIRTLRLHVHNEGERCQEKYETTKGLL